MPDIRIVQRTGFPRLSVGLDWSLLPSGALDQSEALATAFIVALTTDHVADAADQLPEIEGTNRRGWWGDLDAEEIWGGWPIGSRLWLLARGKIVGSDAFGGATVTRVEDYAYEALFPFITNKIVSSIDVVASRNLYDMNRVDCSVTAFRGAQTAVNLQFQVLWNEMAGRIVF